MSSSQEQKEYQALPLRVLIIANSRFKGGLSGSDAIYESFKKYWPCCIRVQSMEDIDYKPFFLCYIHRIILSWFMAIIEPTKYDIVYSSSDFLPDSIAGFIYKIKGSKWVAGYYLQAFQENKLHYYSQKLVRQLIDKFADMVIVTNPTMYNIFPDKKKTWINGGIDLSKAGISNKPKFYDAVFCGRIHPSKGIDDLVDIWIEVLKHKPNAKLAVIGDGDLGKDYIKYKFYEKGFDWKLANVFLLGYMGDERFEVYKESKVVLYPTPPKYDHFSMAPVEAMACGCGLICFDNTLKYFNVPVPYWGMKIKTNKEFSDILLRCIDSRYVIDSQDIPCEWAQQFDYEQQSLRVYNEIKKELYG